MQSSDLLFKLAFFNGFIAMLHAYKNKRKEMASTTESGTDIHKKRKTISRPCVIPKPLKPFHWYAENNKMEGIKRHLREGTDINLQDSQGKTALYIASAAGNTKLTIFLLSKKAKKNIRDFRGNNPLSIALYKKNNEVLRALGIKNPEQHPDYGQPLINQIIIEKQLIKYINLINPPPTMILTIKKMIYWLFNKKIPNSFIDENGNCAGFSFVYAYHSARKQRNQFFDSLRKIARWDGSLERLQDEVTHCNANVVEDIFKQMINDIAWFQLTEGVRAITTYNLKDQFFINMWKAVKPETIDFKKVLISSYDFEEMVSFDLLTKVLKKITIYPNTVAFIDIDTIPFTVEHRICIHIDKNKRLRYYNPNHDFQITENLTVTEIAKQLLKGRDKIEISGFVVGKFQDEHANEPIIPSKLKKPGEVMKDILNILKVSESESEPDSEVSDDERPNTRYKKRK